MNWKLFCQELGKRLKLARKKAGLTQEQVAKAIGLTRQYIIQIEQGKALNVSFNIILDFLTACNGQWADFFEELKKVMEEFSQVIDEIGLSDATDLTAKQKQKVDRDISYYRMRIDGKKGKAKPLTNLARHQASVKFGKYRIKIGRIEAEIQKKLGELNVPIVQNQGYKDFARECYSILKKENMPRINTDKSSVRIRGLNDKLNQIIEKWLKQGLQKEVLEIIKEMIINKFLTSDKNATNLTFRENDI